MEVNLKKRGEWFWQLTRALSIAVLCWWAQGVSIMAQSSLDGFNATVATLGIKAIALQPDGKILIGGDFNSVNGQTRPFIARLNPDGTLDTSFADPVVNVSGSSAFNSIALQPDGKIVIAGQFTSVGGQTRIGIARLNPDGTLDASFADPNVSNTVFSIALQPDGKILIAGNLTSVGGQPRNGVARLNADGTLDTSFADPVVNVSGSSRVNSIALQPDGKILVGGNFTLVNGQTRPKIARLNADGTLDTSFGNPNISGSGSGSTIQVSSIAIQPDSKILIGGKFNSVGGQTRNHAARLNADGTLDTSFADPNVSGGYFDPSLSSQSQPSPVMSIALQPDGRILIGGEFNYVSGQLRNRAARLNSNGTLDTSFADPQIDNTVNAVVVQSNGRILVGGNFAAVAGQPRGRLARLNGDGSLEMTLNSANGFNATIAGATPIINAILVQPDSKILIGGDFNSVGGQPRNRIARLNADGSLDTGFPDLSPLDGIVSSIALQPDGKTLIGGNFTFVVGQPRNGVARLNPDGTLDSSFADPVVNVGSSSRVNSIALQPDGKILIAGNFTSVGGQPRNGVARLNADGTLDTSFADPVVNVSGSSRVNSIALQPDGKIVIAGQFNSVGGQTRIGGARLNADGTLDTSFTNPNISGSSARVSSIALQPDGKILIGGNFTSVSSQTRNHVARLNADGSLDSSFADPNVGLSSVPTVTSVALQPDGKIVIAGQFTSVGSQTRQRAARLNSDGSLDTTFSDPQIDNTVNAVVVQSNGRILVGGAFTSVGGQTRQYIARLNADGTVETPVNFSADNYVFSMVTQADGKIIVGGRFSTVLGQQRDRLARLNADGSLDTFNPSPNNEVYALSVQPDGKILVGGYFTSIGNPSPQTRNYIARLNTDGSVDSFNPNASGGVVTILSQPDSRILIAGDFTSVGGQTRQKIARLNADGSLDTSFVNPIVNHTVYALAIQPDGKIVIAGSFTSVGGQTRNGVARLNPDGSLDSTFNTSVSGVVTALAVQPDGKILVGGAFTAVGGQPRNSLARLNADGTVDLAFNPATDDSVYSLNVQSDGKIFVGGTFTQIGGQARNYLARLKPDGTPDSFNPNPNDFVVGLALQSDGKPLVGGNFTQIGSQPRTRFTRLSSDTAALQNFIVTPSAITWKLDGATPNFSFVTFEKSTDGVNYTTLGNGTVSPAVPQGATWALTGQNLALGQNLYIRARGYYQGGIYGGSSSILESVQNVFFAVPTASSASVSGRVFASVSGRALFGATVTLTDMQGYTRATRTNTFGFYRFENVGAGNSYLLQVNAKGYEYAPQMLYVTSDLTGIAFYPLNSGGVSPATIRAPKK